ncbi:bifunctional 5,10-methylenetetrahydrofolate dehydrogenase/5,10-methenyltetrahydrofolate cyclohydrolase [Candidatus Gottesmanbacteria bacterium]|nr:bifunctional 5,10-methylenetetrahydrofolate dehydrogenase/5,10-methenyltetrahydrofolate cyclohydrolase [Candidatus Gottesmanbacteria bacterium]
MKINGRAIADRILDNLSARVGMLKQQGIVPTLAVIQIGDDPGSNAYIRQKQRAAETIGAMVKHEKLPTDTSYQHVNTLIHTYNVDPAIHGLIVQRPLPKQLGDTTQILNQIAPQKDVDGFVPNSPFDVPVVAAVLEILQFVFSQLDQSAKLAKFDTWLKQKHIVVIGRGETAGKPIAEALVKRGCKPSLVHSQTPDPTAITKQADILITCVGKERVITADSIKRNAMLVGVGLWRDTEGKLHGDYEEEEIKDIASAYTPTPGGVGPVNVACLMQNLVLAAQKSS